MSGHPDSFGARDRLDVGGRGLEIFRLGALQERFDVARLPFSLKILLENLLRSEDGTAVRGEDIEALARWDPAGPASIEIAFSPSRVLMQDFTGVPAIVDLAAMRDAMDELGGDPTLINPLVPVELVIDHSIQVDVFGEPLAFQRNAELEFERNRERYAFLRWGQEAFDDFSVVPPNTGICHQVNLEYLANVVHARDGRAFPDTLVGTDSHTTMVNGLGVLGWGVGGIEAEAAMLGQPISMLIPEVVGFRLTGELPEGSTATDLVLTVTQMLRQRRVVSKFVEFFGPGLTTLPLADRATIGNMSPEYGATCGIFPVDAETLRYLRFTGRPAEQVELVEAYCRAQGMFHEPGAPEPVFSDTLELDLSTVEPSLAGPRRPQDRVALTDAAADFRAELRGFVSGEAYEGWDTSSALSFPASDPPSSKAEGVSPKPMPAHRADGAPAVLAHAEGDRLDHGAVVIAAITSCTNTSNPSVMLGAGLLARKAVEAGLVRRPWVKTSLAPGSKVVTEYLERAGLIEPLERLGFSLVGYGCTTCIGNSGPLPEEISREIAERDLTVCSVLSGNRNFEGRIHPEVRMNYLASPPLVVAYALAGRMDLDITREPVQGDVRLADIWPSRREVSDAIEQAVESDMFRSSYGEVYAGDEHWNALEVPAGDRYAWDPRSTYVKRPPYFDGMAAEPDEGFAPVAGARAIVLLGDSVTTDHISPAGAIAPEAPAGRYLLDHGVERRDFNSYGSRRGNHEVMMRGTFANVRLRNRLAPGTEGGVTVWDGEQTSIYEAAMAAAEQGVALCVLAGEEYGSGSSRDWAAKGPGLLGIRFVLARSFERIHRSNLVGMGVLPLQFPDGESAASLGLTGQETFDLAPLEQGATRLRVTTSTGVAFDAKVRIDTPNEWRYFRHGGILHYVLRQLRSGR
ncbi:aconitate hydratase AcnA [Miltoncostaea marina]|uniref:aconitate hydratase AcnA n=1 Tax=Miltoncostaea marina TaxID=2843215 RepID=UPI001C3D4237|nr:aconitate hydratase AcnA [Miltoncostaea marina]